MPGNLISATGWTTGGGTATAGASISLTADGTGTTYARQAVATEPGATYRMNFEVTSPATLPGRLVGATAGGAQIVAGATAAAGSNRIDFAAAGSQAWIQFQRQNAGTATVDMVSVERLMPGSAPARRLDGTAQCFSLDAAAAGLRTANHTLYVGGWVRFEKRNALHYLADLGRADLENTGGNERVRLAVDPPSGGLSKVFCSSDLGANYRECAASIAVATDTWYHVGMSVDAARDVQLWWNGQPAGTKTGSIPAAGSDTCRVLQLGARVGPTRIYFAAASYSDWAWYSGVLPTAAQVAAMAAGTRPGRLAGTPPTHHWEMRSESSVEPAAAGAAPLTAVGGVPRLAVGPDLGAADAPVAVIVV